jgi:glycolate oxidase
VTQDAFAEFGSRATRSLFEREFYAQDLAYVPEPLRKVFTKPVPDVVVRPINREEVAKILSYASGHRLPVTPRAGGSTAYGNAVPARGGILLDMNSFRGADQVDAEQMTVWVAPGTTWFDLEQTLNRQGYAVCTYPSSARVASVGGWFAMGGLGIGSLKYGPLDRLVEAIEVVLPDGEIRTLTRQTSPSLSWFAGTEGTLGVITGLSFKVRRRPECEEHHLIEFTDIDGAVAAVEALIERFRGLVFNAHINSARYNDFMSALGYAGHPQERVTLSIDFEGTSEQLRDCRVEVGRQAKMGGGTVADEALALEEWEARFSSLRVKRQVPNLLGAELTLPLRNFGRYIAGCEHLALRQHTKIASYGHIVDDGRVLAMSLVPTDEETTPKYILDTSLLNRIYDIGSNLGGAPYAIGLWNTPYVKRVYDKAARRQRRERKARLDPKGIMNPGKTYGAPPLLQPWLFEPGMHSLSWLRKKTAKRGSE